jgi:hypothetical protein
LTVRASVTVNVHGAVPVQPPPAQPRNEVEVPGLGAIVTSVPWANVKVQVPGQSRPAGVEVTEPTPLPLRTIVTG